MKWSLIALAGLVMVPAVVYATYGLDLSSACAESTFACLKSAGYRFAVPRGYCSDGVVDPNVINTVKNAWAGGMAHVDVYMFPCPTCGNPAGQVQTAVNNLRSHGATFGMLWLDIEGTQYWMGQTANRAFFEGLVHEAQAMGVVLGVYSSDSQWIPIFGSGYNGGAQFPLWYAHYDGQPNFNDWFPFAGWSRPAIKQYNGDVGGCGLDLDQDWYPDSDSMADRADWPLLWPNAYGMNATFDQ